VIVSDNPSTPIFPPLQTKPKTKKMNNTLHTLKENPEIAFLDWFNNFNTQQGFADYYGIEIAEAKEIISKGKEIHHSKTK
jgi:hypothetical protein